MAFRWRRVGVLAVAIMLGLAGCTGQAADRTDAGAASGTSTPSTTSPTPTPTTSETPTPSSEPPSRTPPPARPISLAFAGDVHFEGQLRDRLSDPAAALSPISAALSAADLTILNLETTIATGGTPQPKRYTFRAPPSALTALAAAGVDVVTMANNHGMDYSFDGLEESISAARDSARAKPPLAVIGIGSDIDRAFAPSRHDVRGVSVAVFGASSADDPTADPTAHWAAGPDRAGIAVVGDGERLANAVRAERKLSDVVLVYLHWGVQGESCPSESQTTLAERLADAGADIVVGTHAHQPQGAGFLGDTFVAYGLGNFVWYSQGAPTGLLTLTATTDGVVDGAWAPARITADGMPTFAGGNEADLLRAEFDALRDCTQLSR